jgi:putative nucleotidyltransferase with HDIG domain
MKQSIAGNITLESVEERLEQLPLLPGVMFELMKSDPDSETFFDDMVRLAKTDPPLASLIIGYANSAACIGNRPVEGIEAALARVGSNTILQLLMAISVARVFVPARDEQRNIWRHSLEVAQIGVFLARTPYFSTVKPETAYMAGLLHDLGRFVMLQVAPDALKDTDVRGWGAAEELIAAEQSTLGFTHTVVGQMACRKMHLPALLSNIVRYHHHHEAVRHPKVPKELRDLLIIIQFADGLSFFLAANPDWPELDADALKQRIETEVVSEAWGGVRLPLLELVHALPMIYADCESACGMLGIRK